MATDRIELRYRVDGRMRVLTLPLDANRTEGEGVTLSARVETLDRRSTVRAAIANRRTSGLSPVSSAQRINLPPSRYQRPTT
jgi:hypothetical protein